MRPPIRKPPEQEIVNECSPVYPLKLDSEFVQISIDPSSTSTGISIFDQAGKYLDGFCIKVSSGIIPSMRLFHLRNKFIEEWERRLGGKIQANVCTLEHLPPTKFSVLGVAAGAILSSGKISADLSPSCYIPPPRWKYVARQLGCKDKDPKGVSALRSIGWEFDYAGLNEDTADSILIHLASRWYKQQILWLSPKKWLASGYVPKPFVKKKTGKKKLK